MSCWYDDPLGVHCNELRIHAVPNIAFARNLYLDSLRWYLSLEMEHNWFILSVSWWSTAKSSLLSTWKSSKKVNLAGWRSRSAKRMRKSSMRRVHMAVSILLVKRFLSLCLLLCLNIDGHPSYEPAIFLKTTTLFVSECTDICISLYEHANVLTSLSQTLL